MKYEVEIRGRVDDFDGILEKFREVADFVKEKKRLSFIYFRDDEDVSDVGSYMDAVMDLRLRVTDGKAEMVMKYGKWGVEESREEHLFPIELERFESALKFFSNLGWNRGVLTDTHTYVFDYNGVEFALVKTRDDAYFEAEILVDCEDDVLAANEKIKGCCEEMGLEIFDEEGYVELINSLNTREGSRFDMRKDKFEEIRERFRDFL